MYRLTDSPISISEIQKTLHESTHGAILLFLGVARDHFDGRPVSQLEYEAYAEMAIPAMQNIGREINARWPGTRTTIVHRTGVVPTTEIAVVIATSTPHRAACYEANRFAIETLKKTVPIWKKEVYSDGSTWKANQS